MGLALLPDVQGSALLVMQTFFFLRLLLIALNFQIASISIHVFDFSVFLGGGLCNNLRPVLCILLTYQNGLWFCTSTRMVLGVYLCSINPASITDSWP